MNEYDLEYMIDRYEYKIWITRSIYMSTYDKDYMNGGYE